MSNKRIVELCFRVSLFLGIFLFISCTWQLLETIICGRIQPSHVDTIIGILFTISLYRNVSHHIVLVWEDSEDSQKGSKVINIEEERLKKNRPQRRTSTHTNI